MRKGAATYAASGSTACPSSTAVHLRAGWSMAGVQDTYLRYQAAGDQFVGRTVAGLPVNDSLFAVLPPFFNAEHRNEYLQSCIKLCFKNVPQSLIRVCEFSLASVVYHVNFLRSTIPKEHILFENPLFTDQSMIENLKSIVSCRLANSNDLLRPTGIPPHICLLNQMILVRDEVKTIVPEVIQGVVHEIESRALDAGTVTRHGLEHMLKNCMQQIGLTDIVDRLNQGSLLLSPEETILPERTGNSVHLWSNGTMHIVPESFRWPNGGILTLWQHWCCGNRQEKIPPFRTINPHDLAHNDTRKRRSDVRFLMQFIENMLPANTALNGISLTVATSLFESIETSLQFSDRTTNNRQRRAGQLKWRSAVNMLRSGTVIGH